MGIFGKRIVYFVVFWTLVSKIVSEGPTKGTS